MYHTSPIEITKAGRGLFGDFICFSGKVYVQTAGKYVTYRLDVSDEEIIEASRLWYQDDVAPLQKFVDEIVNRYEVSESDAEKLLDESESIYNVDSNIEPEDLADASWDIQRITAEAGRSMGFGIVAMSDEQGTVYFVDIKKYFGSMMMVH